MPSLKWADVAHYYIGATVLRNEGFVCDLRPTGFDSVRQVVCVLDDREFLQTFRIGDCSVHLRALEDMTEGEYRELYEAVYDEKYLNHYDASHYFKEKHMYSREDSVLKELLGRPRAWHWLISKGFDVFGLIESGQAIRKGVEGA